MPGNITKRGENSYRLRVTLGTDFRGKAIVYSKTVKCKTEKQAEKELAKFYAECESGKVNGSNPTTVADLSASYLSEYVERYLKVSARHSVNIAINKHINPLLGSKKVTKLKRLDVQQWVNYLSDQGLSPKTVRNYYSALAGMMQFAIDMDIIEDTPCKNIRFPKREATEAVSYTIEEVNALLSALDSVSSDELKYKVGIYIALFGGLRKGEILGLNWEDINFDTGELTISRTRMRANKVGAFEDTPKTEKSKRTVTVPMEIIDMLRDLQLQQKKTKLLLREKYIDSPAVLRSELGKPLFPDTFHKWFKRFIEKNELKPIGLHGLRHTHASMLASLGEDKVKVSNRLGHSQLSTTLNIYTHLFEESDRTLADNLSRNFLSNTKI